ncbi:hypothetical protein VZT92_019796 [Zoarces viviparus]|uniref:CCHC-type domain-containing protein n=1 Tax=Zoarces viviparus TaxID=48416 RepID=A0AAW1EML9_ZOAVI
MTATPVNRTLPGTMTTNTDTPGMIDKDGMTLPGVTTTRMDIHIQTAKDGVIRTGIPTTSKQMPTRATERSEAPAEAAVNNLVVAVRSEQENAARKAAEKVSSMNDLKRLTANVELEGGDTITAMGLITQIQKQCGALLACRTISPRKYELTMADLAGKDKLMEGFRVGDTRVHASELINNELVVSFLNLPFYIADESILAKLASWGVMAVSAIRRRMWPGSRVTDGTRYLRVRFTERVQSLPYSTKFETAVGSEYFRVLHDGQAKICRGCMQPGHILRECPEFLCHKCGEQGHIARECARKQGQRCRQCNKMPEACVCVGELVVEEEKGTEEEELFDLNSAADSAVPGGEDEEQTQMDEEEARASCDVQPEPEADLLAGGELTGPSTGLTPGQVSGAAKEPATAARSVMDLMVSAEGPVATTETGARERVGARATDVEAAGAALEPGATAVQTTVPETPTPALTQSEPMGGLQSASWLGNLAPAGKEESLRLGAKARGRRVSRVVGSPAVTQEGIAVAAVNGTTDTAVEAETVEPERVPAQTVQSGPRELGGVEDQFEIGSSLDMEEMRESGSGLQTSQQTEISGESDMDFSEAKEMRKRQGLWATKGKSKKKMSREKN